MGKDAGKIAGIAALGATGLGLANIGPLASMLGSGAGAGAAGAGAAGGGLGLLAPGASTAATGAGLSIGGAGTGAGLGAASGLTPTAAMMGGNALLSPAITGGATGLPAMASKSLFANLDPMKAGMMGAQMMNQGQQQQRPGMPPPVMPMQGQGQPQQPFTGMSPYQLPGGLKLHSMNTAGMFRRG